MGVNVESRRCSSVSEASRNNRDRNTCTKHLSRHEVTEVVQAKVLDAGCPAMPDELLRHPVRIPRAFTDWVVGENERGIEITGGDRGDPAPLFLE